MVWRRRPKWRYRTRARTLRHAVRFWWQAFALVGLTLFSWSRFPLAALMAEPRVLPELPAPRAAYVTLDPAYAAQAFRKPLTAWTLGGPGRGRTTGIELDSVHWPIGPPPPVFLEAGSRYPGIWQPAPVGSIPSLVPEISSDHPPFRMPDRRPDPPAGVRVSLSRDLALAGFTFPHDAVPLPDRSGHGRYYVETDAEGGVAHVLLLTPRTTGAAAYERALHRGRAKGATRGFLEIHWRVARSL